MSEIRKPAIRHCNICEAMLPVHGPQECKRRAIRILCNAIADEPPALRAQAYAIQRELERGGQA